MPRAGRIKGENSIYHIMSRSISEINLYKSAEDKEKYIEIMKKYKDIFKFKVYGYCIMNTHNHFIIDSNGSDISKIMHGVNQSYAQYYNRKYKRHGHVFQDRFKSKIVDNDKYLITLSAYIHSNPMCMKKYSNKLEKYKFSSLGIYLGTMNDKYSLVDKDFLLKHFSSNEVNAKETYLDFVRRFSNNSISENIELKKEKAVYLSHRKIIARYFTVEAILKFLNERYQISESILRMKNSRSATEKRAVFVLLMRSLCNFKYRDICEIIGNITQSRVSMLCNIGVQLINSKEDYAGLLDEIIIK
ncbi:MAG: hypothetical protein K0R54_1171 [Clostridiaceae bacterium]|jgi:REP element-mobilizing transposase RayT|nr:hypothetical protein [Clostridiaceae bacterium]